MVLNVHRNTDEASKGRGECGRVVGGEDEAYNFYIIFIDSASIIYGPAATLSSPPE